MGQKALKRLLIKAVKEFLVTLLIDLLTELSTREGDSKSHGEKDKK